MFETIAGSTQGLPDVETFIELINRLEPDTNGPAHDLFTPEAAITVARAPGRLDVMGGIADYSGSLVLQLPIAEATLAALQPRNDRQLHIVSLGADHNDRSTTFTMSLDDFGTAEQPLAYADAKARLTRDPTTAWAAYVVGTFLVLMREKGARFPHGASILISSQVPEGKGVSSSAAIEVATMRALSEAYQIPTQPRELAILCQKVENLVVGAPCGVMDQMTSACGESGRLLALLCQPAELLPSVEIPADLEVWGLDSGVRHSVSGSDYGSVRTGAFMGYRIIAELAGLDVDASCEVLTITDPRFKGHLANVPPSLFEQVFAPQIPDTLAGDAFLQRYVGTHDPVTRVQPDRGYAVRTPAAHPIHEHFRVATFAELLRDAPGERRLELLGELMYQSHASYSACGLGSEGTDRLVELVRQAGPARGLYGAKITGGGSGGTVAVLGRRGASDAIAEVTAEYARTTGHTPYVFSGSSPGACHFGTLTLRR